MYYTVLSQILIYKVCTRIQYIWKYLYTKNETTKDFIVIYSKFQNNQADRAGKMVLLYLRKGYFRTSKSKIIKNLKEF